MEVIRIGLSYCVPFMQKWLVQGVWKWVLHNGVLHFMKSTMAPYIHAFLPTFITSYFVFLSFLVGKANKALVFLADWIRDDETLSSDSDNDENENTSDNENDTRYMASGTSARRSKQAAVQQARSSSSSSSSSDSRPVVTEKSRMRANARIEQRSGPRLSYKMYAFIALLLYHCISVMILASRESGVLEHAKLLERNKFEQCKRDKGGEPRCKDEKEKLMAAEAAATVFNSILSGLLHYSPIGGMYSVGPSMKNFFGVHSVGDFVRIFLVLFVPLSFAFVLAYVAWLVMQPSKTKKKE